MSGILMMSVGNSYGYKPVNTVAPAVTGTATVGQTLSCSTGTWDAAPPVTSYAYQWLRSGSPISGATSSTYTLVSADAGATISCTVTATNAVGVTSATSNSTAAVTQAPVNTVAPVVSGTATVLSTLSCSTGTWTGTPSPSYAYQWQRNGSNISGANSSTYALKSADIGTTVRCVVTATNAAGSVSANSNSTATVTDLSIGASAQGGYYTGKIVQGGTTYYLFVAPKSSGENSSKQWKTSNDAGPAATRTLNNGPAASSSMNSATYPAAQFCEGLSIGGYTDWYLPARDELELCYRNLKPTTSANNTGGRSKSSYTYPEGNDVSGDTMGINRNSDPTGAAYTSGSPAQTSVSAFQTGNSEAFAAGYYWSSSEYSSTGAWRQNFDDGTQNVTSKNNSYYVRAVRRVAA